MPEGQEPQSTESQVDTPESVEDTPEQEGQEPESQTQTQTFDAEYVKKLRAEAAANRKAAKDFEARLKEIEDASKSEEQKRQERLQELEPKAQRAERLEEALKAHLEAQRSGLPKHVTDLLDRLDTADQLEWLATNREAIAQGGASSGSPTNPSRQRGSQSLDEQVDAKLSPESRRFWHV